jgi:hypothetical protein
MLFIPDDPEAFRAAAAELEERLSVHLPSPEADLIGLSHAVAHTPATQRWAEVRRLTIDIDDLVAQVRWHIAQANLLLSVHPEIADPRLDAPEVGHRLGIVNSARLLLRAYVVDADRVIFSSPTDRRRDGTAGGWIFHMLLDSAITRAVSTLDRIARVAALIGEVQFGNGKVYFRSGKLEAIHRVVLRPETEALHKLSEQDYLKFLIEYRDGAAHRVQDFSRPLGLPPADSYIDDEGMRILVRDSYFPVDDLLAVAITGYTAIVDALHELRSLAEALAPERKGG